jgi:D-psicose/D-tagatose/L-ribulose 3-epimerase
MRLAISNIAWDVAEDSLMRDLFHRYHIDAIDIAPTKYFSDVAAVGETEVLQVRDWWRHQGVEITGMQSLLFGTTGLNVFGPAKVQGLMLQHLAVICRIGRLLGAPRLVFGSPRNRDRNGIEDSEVIPVAVDFFRRLGDIAAAEQVIICLEPNPPCYGANFMTTSDGTAEVVRAVNHQAIRMQLDLGAVAINSEDLTSIVVKHRDIIGHIHASEPNLVPLGDGGVDHDAASVELIRNLPNMLVSIEMLATSTEPHAVSIERALKVATLSYKSGL